MPGETGIDKPQVEKKVFLVAAFRHIGSTADGPVSGVAEDVVAVIGMSGGWKRFAWVGADRGDSIDHPALVTPVKVRLALASPWHREGDNMVTGLVQLAHDQLGTGPVDDDVDHLLSALAASRATGHRTVERQLETESDDAAVGPAVAAREIVSR